jgi:hypothetical protein
MSKLFWGEERSAAMDRAAGPLPRMRTSHVSLDVGGGVFDLDAWRAVCMSCKRLVRDDDGRWEYAVSDCGWRDTTADVDGRTKACDDGHQANKVIETMMANIML